MLPQSMRGGIMLFVAGLGWLLGATQPQAQPRPLFGTVPPALVHYGAEPVVGEALEPCETEQTIPAAVVLTSTDRWAERLRSAQPGETLLLRTGVYTTSALLKFPAGAVSAPITLKPYNCEPVTLYASLRLRSYNVVAGLHIETVGVNFPEWVIRVDGEATGPVERVIIRHNTIWGGLVDAIRVVDDATRILITGNQIDGGGNGHNIFITSEERRFWPDLIEVSNNRLSKRYFNTPAEDMFQVRDVRNVLFSHNTCTDGLNLEECVDIKSAQAPVWVSGNFFDGDLLHQTGRGEDNSGGCLVIHETDGHPEPHMVIGNFFRNCKRTALRFASGELGEISQAVVEGNLLTHSSNEDGIISIWQAQNVVWNHNTVVNGYLKLGNDDQDKLPINTLITNNIFYGTRIDDRTQPPASTYQCRNNLFYQLAGIGFTQSPCQATVIADPLFVNPNTNDFHLPYATPARNQGDDGLTLGVYAYDFVDESPGLYLPIIAKQW